MDELIYNYLRTYFDTLKHTGYIKLDTVNKLIVLVFIKNLLNNDFRGHIEEYQYKDIDKALYCLFGTSCLIPYPEYIKMGKLHIGEISEIAHKLCKLNKFTEELDLHIQANDSITNNNTKRIELIEDTKVVKGQDIYQLIEDIHL